MRPAATNHEAISQIVFDEHYVVPADQMAHRLFGQLPCAGAHSAQLVDAMATAYLIAVLESMCLRELYLHVDQSHETVVGASVECRHSAPIPAGAVLRISGWVEQMSDDDITFCMQAQDLQERVCEASIQLAIVRREQIAGRITRKREAIERQQLYLSA